MSLECPAERSAGSRQEISKCPTRYLRDEYKNSISKHGRMSESEDDGTAKSIERAMRLEVSNQGT